MQVTLDGYDPFTGDTIGTIRVWKNYQQRNKGIAFEAQHGDTVKLCKRNGQACKVRITLDDGEQRYGWVSFWFIKELKREFVREMEEGEQNAAPVHRRGPVGQ